MLRDYLEAWAGLAFLGLWCFAALGIIALWSRAAEADTDGKPAIKKWARENHYGIIVLDLKKSNFRSGYQGPFAGKASTGQSVYRVVVSRLGEEKRRVVWVRYGTGPTNSADEFTVIWEDEWRPPEPPIG